MYSILTLLNSRVIIRQVLPVRALEGLRILRGKPMANENPKMEPMFLPGVEHNPQPGSYADMIRMMQDSGCEYPQIWHMFAYLPKATEHLARFTQEILRGPGAFSPGIRELIAAFTSYRNACPF
jgi:hypothetical protein